MTLLAQLSLICFAWGVAGLPPEGPAADVAVAVPTPVDAPAEPVPAGDLGVPTPIADPSGRALERFYSALDATSRGEDKTRVVVWGASHMAGDLFTKIIRHRLQDRFGDAGPGFIVPSAPWRDYNHRDANITYSKRGWSPYYVSSKHARDDGLYGLAGCSFESRDDDAWCRVETARQSPFGRQVTDVEVYFWKQKRGGDFYVVIDGDDKRKGKRHKVKTRSRAEGPGYVSFALDDGPHSIEIRPRGNGKVTLFGVALDRSEPGVVMDVMGINGARASAQLQWDPRLFAEHLTRRKPDMVVLAYGTNATGDTHHPIEAYERQLDLVLNRVKSLVPQASCLLLGPTDRPIKVLVPDTSDPSGRATRQAYLPRPRQAQLVATQRRVATRYGCGYWDMVAAMGGDMSMLRWVASEPRLGSRDYVHLTRPGYERLADLFWDSLMVAYPERDR